jgi:predicted ribosomally synthesized peptide with SipW-like signal peptide
MKKRTKSLLAAFCTMALCGCLIAGSTYALFTDTAEVNIAVTSGKVDVEANVQNGTLKTYSASTTDTDNVKIPFVTKDVDLGPYSADYYYVQTNKDTTDNGGTFTNGGTASLNTVDGESQLTLSNITPGDKVEFKVDITNNSNVAVMYKVTLEELGDSYKIDNEGNKTQSNYSLKDVLDIDVDTYQNIWVKWTKQETKTVDVSISMPITLSDQEKYASLETKLVIKVEAVQANANFGDNYGNVDITTSTTDDGVTTLAEKVTVSTANATATLNSGTAILADTDSVALSVTQSSGELAQTKYNIQVDGTDSIETYDITVAGISSENTKYVTVVLNNIYSDIQKVYHCGSEMTELTGDLPTDSTVEGANKAGYYKYDNGKLTIYTTSFSPFTVECKYAGGIGTENYPYLVSTAEQYLDAIANVTSGQYIQLTTGIDIGDKSIFGSQTLSKNVSIDLKDNELKSSYSSSLVVNENYSLEIKNGTLNFLDGNLADNNSAITVNKGASITLYKVEYYTKGTALYPEGNAARINMIDSTIDCTGAYGIGTNASGTQNYGIIINIQSSKIYAYKLKDGSYSPYGTAVMTNVPSTVTISDSTLIGSRHGLAIRSGTATVSNSEIYTYGIDVDTKYGRVVSGSYTDWNEGNCFPVAAIVVGNTIEKTAYVGDAICDLTNVNAYLTKVDSTSITETQLIHLAASNKYDASKYEKTDDSQQYYTKLNFTGGNIESSKIELGYEEIGHANGSYRENIYINNEQQKTSLPTPVEDTTELSNALSSGSSVVLTADITNNVTNQYNTTKTIKIDNQSADVNLNNKTISISSASGSNNIQVTGNNASSIITSTISNGTVNAETPGDSYHKFGTSQALFYAKYCSLTLDNMKVTLNDKLKGVVVTVSESKSELYIKNSNIKGVKVPDFSAENISSSVATVYATVNLANGGYAEIENSTIDGLICVGGTSTLKIISGNFTNTSFWILGNCTISGGTFAVDPTTLITNPDGQNNKNVKIAEGYEVVENPDGTYTVQLKKS